MKERDFGPTQVKNETLKMFLHDTINYIISYVYHDVIVMMRIHT